MSKRFLALVTIAVLVCLGSPALAAEPAAPASETKLDLLLSSIRANRKALIAVNLNLTPEQDQKFWPLYDQYQKEMNVVGDRMGAIVKEYIESFQTISDEKALQLSTDYLDAEAERIKIKRNYIGEFAKILPGRTVARFYQLENKMDAVIRYDLASTIPVVDDAR